METLAFYSYKGGVGRSLLLANAARFLASLGKGVVALDLDFEAPGLHYKLGRAVSRELEPEKIGGAVPYLIATAQGAVSPPRLEEHMIDVPVPPDSGGWLRLMPAGPAPGRVYWAALKELGERIHFDDSSGQGLLSLLDLHARIKEELKPDYLLIDARTGVTELGGLATTILADTVVCIFVANLESSDGTLTVVEALTATPRLKGRRPVRVVPVLARTTSDPPGVGPFAVGMKRLLELGQGRRLKMTSELKPFVLPHDDTQSASDRVIVGGMTASEFSPLYKSYLELFQKLFPSSAKRAKRALSRLAAVASFKEVLTGRHPGPYGSEDIIAPWNPTSIDEGVSFQIDRSGSQTSRYADLVCRDRTGQPLMIVEYVEAEAGKDEPKEFWENFTSIRCLVLLYQRRAGGVDRRIFSRQTGETELRSANRWDPPFPREFDLLPDVGNSSVDAMLDALSQGHIEAAALLVQEWRYRVAAVVTHRAPDWRPNQAQRILDGLAATESLSLAEEILRLSAPARSDPWHELSGEKWSHGGELDHWMEKELFAPLFWRLPVEAVESYEKYPRPWLTNRTPCLAGYRMIAEGLMGLRYDPKRSALAQVQPSGRRDDDLAEDGAYQDKFSFRLDRGLRDDTCFVRLSEEPPPILIWEEVLKEEPYWRGTLEAAKKMNPGDKARKLVASKAKLRRRLQERFDRQQLVTGGLLGHYDALCRLEIFSRVIAVVAELLAVPPRYLKSVVFIHLSVRALAHKARDLDWQLGYGFAPSPPTSPDYYESPVHVSLAQNFTHRLIERLEDPNLMAAFEKLSQYQPETYRQWGSLREVPLERMRVLLMRARAAPAAVGIIGNLDTL